MCGVRRGSSGKEIAILREADGGVWRSGEEKWSGVSERGESVVPVSDRRRTAGGERR